MEVYHEQTAIATYFSVKRFFSYFSASEKNSSSSAGEGDFSGGGLRPEVASFAAPVFFFFFGVDVDNDSISSDSKETTLDADVSLL